ncbi:short-chain dehydrogenase-3 [Coleophoma cylindrospora]|uniref:Short-chain dehydrogenase-3 n=1 Tax=Coleophoma cylindrospora TaxID=1849047 RepID=A0A3D8SU32_9HELO|nr:short-chain dehydrogenase-3 [Coleophoma cylindrospora]
MPHINVIRSAVAELSKGPPLVVVLVGGTTGIGSYVANSFAKSFASNGSKLRVYIVGRNATRAKAVMTYGETTSPGSDWRFIAATDLALISEVDRSCAEIIRQETEAPLHNKPSIDLLYMSHSYPILKERSTTSEGLDAFISTLYYSRMRFIMQLLPLLTASSLPGHAISIYAGGMEDGTSKGEFPIGCPPPETYGVSGVRKHTCFMKNFMFEEFAERNVGKLSLTHIYPGLVDGPGFYNPEMPKWFRVVWRLVKPLVSFYMTSASDCGDVMVYLATSRYPAKGTLEGNQVSGDGVEVAKSTLGELGGGSYAVGQRGDTVAKGKSYEKVREEGMSKKIWDHTMETFTQIEEEHTKAP